MVAIVHIPGLAHKLVSRLTRLPILPNPASVLAPAPPSTGSAACKSTHQRLCGKSEGFSSIYFPGAPSRAAHVQVVQRGIYFRSRTPRTSGSKRSPCLVPLKWRPPGRREGGWVVNDSCDQPQTKAYYRTIGTLRICVQTRRAVWAQSSLIDISLRPFLHRIFLSTHCVRVRT